MNSYKAENIINFRDFAGYKAKGGTITEAKAFRCGLPRNPSEKDLNLLKSLGIKTIIDLRGDAEVYERPSSLEKNPDFDYFHTSLLEANPALNDVNLPIWQMYAMSLKDYSKGYAEVFRLIGRLNEPFVYHCFLGKDRTGILSALLMQCAEISREETIHDYEVSFDYLLPFLEKEWAENTGLIWEQDISRLQSARENIELTLDYLEKDYGGVIGYLHSIGLTDKEISAAGNKFIK